MDFHENWQVARETYEVEKRLDMGIITDWIPSPGFFKKGSLTLSKRAKINKSTSFSATSLDKWQEKTKKLEALHAMHSRKYKIFCDTPDLLCPDLLQIKKNHFLAYCELTTRGERHLQLTLTNYKIVIIIIITVAESLPILYTINRFCISSTVAALRNVHQLYQCDPGFNWYVSKFSKNLNAKKKRKKRNIELSLSLLYV